MALMQPLSNCYQKTYWNATNPHKHWLFTTFQFIQTLFLRLFHPYFWWLLVPIIPVFRAIILCFNRSVYFSCTPKSGISLLSEFSIRRRYIKNEVIISKNSQKDNLVTSKILVGAGFHFLGSLRLFHFGGIYVRISIRAKTNRGLPTLPHLPAVCAVLNHRPEHPHRRQLLSFLLHHSLLLCQLPYLIPQDWRHQLYHLSRWMAMPDQGTCRMVPRPLPAPGPLHSEGFAGAPPHFLHRTRSRTAGKIQNLRMAPA